MPGPAVKVVTTISSKDSAKASRAPARSAERTSGKVTSAKARKVVAPRSIAASSYETAVRRSRATTLLKTTTMQKVAWPTITVNRPRPTPSGARTVPKAELRAMPVTMPGSAMGRTTTKDTVSRPKKRCRATANAMSVPRTSAIAVAPRPAFTDTHRAPRAPELSRATDHQCRVSPGGGQLALRSGFRELTRTSSSGT